jgi:hypothetical protein
MRPTDSQQVVPTSLISIIVLFVETPRKFITAKLSIRKPILLAHIIIIIIIRKLILSALMKIRAYGSKALQ